MIKFNGRGILLDIEGTTSSVRFVYEVMFPLVRRELGNFLADHWAADSTQRAAARIARDAGHESLADWAGARANDQQRRELVRDEVLRLMDGDVKATGLKELQGLIWRDAFQSGALKAHLYDDVPPALRAWTEAGLDVRIYSSGSIVAQKLFFGHTIHGDFRGLLRGHYDTTTGPKQESASYVKIALDFPLPAAEILFLSDVPAELNAARGAGMQTGLCRRPENATVPSDHGHPELENFGEIEI